MDMDALMLRYADMQKSSGVRKNPSQKSHKRANAPTPEEKEAARQGYSYEMQMEADNRRRANPMEVWLNRYGTVDKDRIQDEADENERSHNINYLKQLRPEDRIDLHMMTRDEAWSALESFVAASVRKGFRKVLIIHGKGEHSHGSDPVLGPMVKSFIEQDKRLGLSGHPDRNHGGSGATWVIIRQ